MQWEQLRNADLELLLAPRAQRLQSDLREVLSRVGTLPRNDVFDLL